MATMTKEEKWKEIQSVIAKCNRSRAKERPDAPPAIQFGKDLSGRELVSTGNIAVDRIMGGGCKQGALVEICGDQGCGKTSSLMEWIANVQKNGGTCLYMLTEGNFDDITAELVGVDLDKLMVLDVVGYIERALDDLKTLLWDEEKQIPRNAFDLIVIDSISAFLPKAELEQSEENGMDASTVAVQARLMSKLFRILVGGGMIGNAIVAWTSQMRSKIITNGDPRTTSGGNAPGFYATYRLHYRREFIKLKTDVIGHIVHVTAWKNKSGLAKPYTTGEFSVYYGIGVDHVGGLIDAIIADGLITEESQPISGKPRVGMFGVLDATTGEVTPVRSKDTLKAYVKERPELVEQIKAYWFEESNRAVMPEGDKEDEEEM